ncbi:hypothetical protein LTR35_009471 [Friedmanniomyces endolithicus]|uniref:Uncharacterized protein n=1 Tax=Friedmanniomyces endolithicus TaxID=329885 RepID=A0AAN6FH30_9PEZI|nr:hypothetical protein LTR35_009471 [Friedmanniomyces endolithicus]KAK0290812.1 hypothetical protein LTS00_008589 [Friedmanniomyces endolithicus]KAK0317049.1 hypothetical protein LTR82_011918 [Friedmanniomyces endolithicus]KAK0997905.1 hypothetical protein LTR54_009703 [Friedmanniomyces endolithicus]
MPGMAQVHERGRHPAGDDVRYALGLQTTIMEKSLAEDSETLASMMVNGDKDEIVILDWKDMETRGGSWKPPMRKVRPTWSCHTRVSCWTNGLSSVDQIANSCEQDCERRWDHISGELREFALQRLYPLLTRTVWSRKLRVSDKRKASKSEASAATRKVKTSPKNDQLLAGDVHDSLSPSDDLGIITAKSWRTLSLLHGAMVTISHWKFHSAFSSSPTWRGPNQERVHQHVEVHPRD